MDTNENEGQVPADGSDKQVVVKPEIGYLSHEGFTSEIFKIEVKGLPKYYGFSEMKKLVNVKLKLDSNKIKIPGRNSDFAFICFKNEEGFYNNVFLSNSHFNLFFYSKIVLPL